MKRYYNIMCCRYGYDSNDDNLFYNGFKITSRCKGDALVADGEYNVLNIVLEKHKLFSKRVESIYIPVIIEYDTDTNRYYDIITGEEYVEKFEKERYLVNKGGNLEFVFDSYAGSLSVNEVAETLKKITPFEIEAYSIAMSNLKKAADERARIIDNKRKESENCIEAFKRNRKR